MDLESTLHKLICSQIIYDEFSNNKVKESLEVAYLTSNIKKNPLISDSLRQFYPRTKPKENKDVSSIDDNYVLNELISNIQLLYIKQAKSQHINDAKNVSLFTIKNTNEDGQDNKAQYVMKLTEPVDNKLVFFKNLIYQFNSIIKKLLIYDIRNLEKNYKNYNQDIVNITEGKYTQEMLEKDNKDLKTKRGSSKDSQHINEQIKKLQEKVKREVSEEGVKNKLNIPLINTGLNKSIGGLNIIENLKNRILGKKGELEEETKEALSPRSTRSLRSANPVESRKGRHTRASSRKGDEEEETQSRRRTRSHSAKRDNEEQEEEQEEEEKNAEQEKEDVDVEKEESDAKEEQNESEDSEERLETEEKEPAKDTEKEAEEESEKEPEETADAIEVNDKQEAEKETEKEAENSKLRSRKRRLSSSKTRQSKRIKIDSTPDKKFVTVATQLISNISSLKFASPFLLPVNENDAPNYHSVIYAPRDLKSIKAMVRVGEISSFKQLEREILLMFANAVMYNRTNTNIRRWALEMEEETTNVINLFSEAKRDAEN